MGCGDKLAESMRMREMCWTFGDGIGSKRGSTIWMDGRNGVVLESLIFWFAIEIAS